MGCGKIASNRSQVDYLSNLKTRILHSENLKSGESLHCQVPQSLKKLKIEKVHFSTMEMQGVTIQANDINQFIGYLVDMYLDIKQIVCDFYEICHSECIEDFKVTDGLLIMLLSIGASNNGSLSYSFSSSPPYFTFNSKIENPEAVKIYEVWTRFEKKMEGLMKSHFGIYIKLKEIEKKGLELERVFNMLEEFKESVLEFYDANIKAAAQGMVISEKIRAEVTSLHDLILSFGKGLKGFDWKLQDHLAVASERRFFSAEQIIHQLLSEEQ